MVSTGSIIAIIVVIIIAIIIIGVIIYYKNSTTSISINTRGGNKVKPSVKFIKIYNPANSFLQIWKLKVFHNETLIPLRVVSASPSYNPIANPIDAVLDYSNEDNKKFYHSIETPGAYALLELTQTVNLPVLVQLYNRRDCCEARMLGFRVALLDTNSNIIEEKTIDKVELIYNILFNDKI